MSAEERLLAEIEAVLMVADSPVSASQLAEVTDTSELEVRDAVEKLNREYLGESGDSGRKRGFEIRHVGGGWRIYARPQHRELVEAFVLSGQKARLSQAALETLAVIAYRQPVARSEIAAIRGVNVDSVIKTLQHRTMIEEMGVHESSGATLYGTTQYFLERLGVDNLSELPQISPHLPGIEDLAEVTGSLHPGP